MMNGWKILIVGNNPLELSLVNDQLHEIRETAVKTEMAFDMQTTFQRLAKFDPQHILIDDNIGKSIIQRAVARIQGGVPITVLKNSNYHDPICTGVTNYVLKQSLNSGLLYRELLNSIHFQERQAYLERTYRRRRGQLTRLLEVVAIQI